MSIQEKLLIIQQGLVVPKDQRNDFGKYNYRSCEDILKAVKPLLMETRTILRMTDEIAERGGRIYVQALVSLIDTESTGSIEAIAYAREEDTKKGMDSSQITGAASSYARKYALCGLLAIDDNRDSDATNDHGKQEEKKESKPVQNKQALIETSDGYYKCSHCGQPISGVKQADGTVLSPKDVAIRTKVKFGEPLCLSCSKERSYE